MIFPKGNIYGVKSNGPSTEPWGTPYCTCDRYDTSSFTATNWWRSDKYDLNHANALPLMPTKFSSLFKRMLWSIVSNAALRSSRTNREIQPRSDDRSRSLVTQWEKVAKCNFKSKAQVHERCFFLMKWNVICNAEDRFSCVRAFCRASHVRASMYRITSLELLRTLKLCLMQLRKWRECKATDAEKFLSQREKVAKCNFKSNAQVHERCFFLMKWNVICNAEDRFSCLEVFLRAKNTNAVRAKNTNAVFSATKQWRECKAKDAEKLLLSEKDAKCNFKIKAQVHERCFFSWNEMLFAMQRQIFMC